MTQGSRVRGLVRPPRRPPGWRAPGPRPPEVVDEALLPGAGEDLCHLTGDFRILQRVGGHRWSLDDLLTAHFAVSLLREAPPARFADLGCGIGSVLMMLAWSFPSALGVGIEAQAESVSLVRRSLAWNGLEHRCSVHHGDLREPMPEQGTFDLVTGTPPYLPIAAARRSPDAQRWACRLETRGGIEEYCLAAAPLLAPGGRFVCCMPGEPGGRVGRSAERAGLVIDAHRPVVPREGKPPLFTLWSLRRGPGRGALRRPPLVVRDAQGRWTPELVRVRREMGMPVGRFDPSLEELA